jgi:Ca2+/Na+ antiporter
LKKRIISAFIAVAAVFMLSLSALAASSPDIGTALSTAFSGAVGDAISGIMAIIPIGLQIFAIMFCVKAGMRMFKTTASATG